MYVALLILARPPRRPASQPAASPDSQPVLTRSSADTGRGCRVPPRPPTLRTCARCAMCEQQHARMPVHIHTRRRNGSSQASATATAAKGRGQPASDQRADTREPTGRPQPARTARLPTTCHTAWRVRPATAGRVCIPVTVWARSSGRGGPNSARPLAGRLGPGQQHAPATAPGHPSSVKSHSLQASQCTYAPRRGGRLPPSRIDLRQARGGPNK